MTTELGPLIRRLRYIVAWDEPWDYEDDETDSEAAPSS